MTATARENNDSNLYTRTLTPKGIKLSENRSGTRTATFFASVRYAKRDGFYDLMVTASGKALADIEPELVANQPICVYGIHEDLITNDGRRQRSVFRVIGLSRPKDDTAPAPGQQPPTQVPARAQPSPAPAPQQAQPEAKKRQRRKAAEQPNTIPANNNFCTVRESYTRDLDDEIPF